MTYQDALDYLKIADNAYNIEAYSESADIVRKLAFFAAKKDNGLLPQQREEIVEEVIKAINRFYSCPDEGIWEETCELGDLFK